VDVEHRDPLKQRLRNESAVGHDHAALDIDVVDVSESVSDAEPETSGGGLHGTGTEFASASAAPVWSSNDQHNVVTRVDEGVE
jgi:hypothetical protein